VDLLRAHGYHQMADAVDGQVNGESRRRDSVYGTAAQMASCLKVRAIAHWVAPVGGTKEADRRPQFDPHAFVRSTDTLYSLSKEGKGTAGPLVTALTAATVEAAEELATTQPGGRLATPLLGVLDEAANACRWHALPDLYSHYGSRGIVLMTILQSWSQGVEVWGRDGMRKLWSAANIAVYGGGVKEPEFCKPPAAQTAKPSTSAESHDRLFVNWRPLKVERPCSRPVQPYKAQRPLLDC
jgi:type IV secretory pathway TraG/TraD family ATPase VirD4